MADGSGRFGMPSVTYQFAHRRLQVVEEAVEEWQINHVAAQVASDAEELIDETVELLNPLKRTIRLLPEDGPDPAAVHEQWARAHDIGFLLNKAVIVFEKVTGLAAEVRRLSYTVEGLEQFEKSKKELNRIKADFFRTWSLPDEESIKNAKHQIANGNCRVL
jgi:hypothetical protein